MCTGAVRTTATSTATKAARITPTSRYVPPIVLVRIRIPPVAVQRLLVDDDPLRQDHDETTALPAPRRAACLAPVPPRNLPHQRKPQPRACNFLGSPTAVERVEHPLALGLGYAGPAVADGEFRAVLGAGDAHFDRRGAVAFCVFQQVAEHPTQQARVAANGDQLAFELGVLVTRAFFRREREQVYLFVGLPFFHR